MSKIKVLHYLRHLGLGGTEKTCQLFFEHASKDKFEVAVAYDKLGVHPRKSEFENACLINGGLLHEITDAASLQSVIDSFQANILHVYRSGYEEFPEPGIHVNVPHCVETNVFGFLDPNPRIDRSLFMSEWLMHHAVTKRGIPLSKRFDFVNNPVEAPCTENVLSVSSQWHNEGAIIVGRCGRPDNGIYNSINVDAVRLLRMQGYDIRFIVVAPPSNMIDDLTKYEIPFSVIEPTVHPLVLSTFYNSIDIYAHARADGETFGVNIAEAMMHGKPVVTHYARPSFPGMGVFQAQVDLVDTSETGWVVNNHPAEYADALKMLIDDKEMRKRMSKASAEKAACEFHIDVCMHKLENIYNEVVNG